MLSFLVAALSSKVVIDSTMAGAGLGMSIYQCAKSIKSNGREIRRRRRR